MKTIYADQHFQLPSDWQNGIAASVGFFDGVHKGHQFLISQLRTIAQKSGLPNVIITFPEHPRKILQRDYRQELLTGFEEKLRRLSTTGVDYCLVIHFTKEISELSAREFIQEYLCKKLHVRQLIVGHDHKFGKGRAGEFNDYLRDGNACGMGVIQAEKLQGESLEINSTNIRKLLSEGRVMEVAEILSYFYTLEGIVITGNKMGREMGFPTANLNLTEKDQVIPKEGIYATRVYIGEEAYQGMTYIGKRPTIFSQGEMRIEIHILDFSRDIYGQTLRIEFVAFLRDDIRFDFVEDLREQLIIDKKNTAQVFISQV